METSMLDNRQNIRELQIRLAALARRYPDEITRVNIDGIYGPEVYQAVEDFQKKFYLPVTGEVDQDTWDSINYEYGKILWTQSLPNPIEVFLRPTLLLKEGDYGIDIYFLQTLISAIYSSYENLGDVSINGTFDENTRKAILKFQEASGLPQTGEVNKQTWNALTTVYRMIKNWEIEMENSIT